MNSHYPTDTDELHQQIQASDFSTEQKQALTLLLTTDSNFLTYVFDYTPPEERAFTSCANGQHVYTAIKMAVVDDLLSKKWDMSFGDILGMPEPILVLALHFDQDEELGNFLLSSGKYEQDTQTHFNGLEFWLTPMDAKRALDMGISLYDFWTPTSN